MSSRSAPDTSDASSQLTMTHCLTALTLAFKDTNHIMAVQSDPDHVDASSALPEELWRHPSPERTRMYAFKSKIETKYDVKLETYNELYQWSIHNIAAFWGEVWIFTGVKASEPFRNVSFLCVLHLISISSLPVGSRRERSYVPSPVVL